MKTCERCGEEMVGADESETVCSKCEAAQTAKLIKSRAAAQRRREKEAVLKSMGLVKVKGALGGTYWE